MEEQKRLAARIDLEDFAAAITRGALRALATQKQENIAQAAEVTPAGFINPIIRLGIWLEIAQGGLQGSSGIAGQTGPASPVGPEGPVG